MSGNVASETPGPPQLSPDGKWWWDGVRWAPVIQNPATLTAARHLYLVTMSVVAMRFVVFFPVGLGLLMAILTPTYWGPMLSTPLGIAMLSAGVIEVAGAFVVTEVAGQLMRRGTRGIAAGIALVAITFFLQFITVWIVLLGPAILILVNARQPS